MKTSHVEFGGQLVSRGRANVVTIAATSGRMANVGTAMLAGSELPVLRSRFARAKVNRAHQRGESHDVRAAFVAKEVGLVLIASINRAVPAMPVRDHGDMLPRM